MLQFLLNVVFILIFLSVLIVPVGTSFFVSPFPKEKSTGNCKKRNSERAQQRYGMPKVIESRDLEVGDCSALSGPYEVSRPHDQQVTNLCNLTFSYSATRIPFLTLSLAHALDLFCAKESTSKRRVRDSGISTLPQAPL
jgi:hypothetical protein